MANSDLRRLMQLKRSGSTKITHPLAKYNNLDQLSCVICSKIIKDEAVWNAHIQSKKHKENVLLIKNKASSPHIKPSSSVKSNLEVDGSNCDKNGIPRKKARTQLPNDFFDETFTSTRGKSIVAPEVNKPKGILRNKIDTSVVNKNISNSSSSSSSTLSSVALTKEENKKLNKETEEINSSSNRKRKGESLLPKDFFDEPKKVMESVPMDTEANAESNTNAAKSDETIPEGFFDDPKKDAKARNVEYKDPKEEEWEKFQKMIQEETKVAETLQEEEDEESLMHKDLLELNKMKTCLSRVVDLKKLVDKGKQKKNDAMEENDNEKDDSSDSDEDLSLMFNWRAKKV